MYGQTNLILRKDYIQYLIPLTLVALGNSLQQFVDTIIVSNLLGSYAMTVENYAGPLTKYATFVVYLVGAGGSVVFARYIGSMERQKAEQVFRVCMLAGLVLGLLVSVPGFFSLEELAGLLGAEGELLPYVKAYLVPTLVLLPITILVNTFGSFLSPMGYPRISSTVLLSANVFNVILDVVYIKYLHMDVDGAQWATVSGYVIAIVGLIVYLRIKKISIPLFRKGKMAFHRLWEAIQSGITPSLSQLGLLIYYGYFNRMLTRTSGSSAVTIFSLCLQVLSVFSIGSQGICGTIRTFIGVLTSDEDYKGIRFILKVSSAIMLIWGVLLFVFVQISPGVFLDLYNIQDARDLGMTALRLYSWLLLFKGFVLIGRDYYNVTKHTLLATMITLIEGSVGVIILGTILGYVMGLNGIWISFPLNALIVFAFVTIRMHLDGVMSDKKDAKHAVTATCTLPMKNLDIERMNETVEDFARGFDFDRETTNRLIHIIEETYIYTRKNGDRIEWMDVLIRRADEKAIMLFRSLGKAFNPVLAAGEDGEEYNIAILSKLPDSVDYEYTIGMNTIRLTLVFDIGGKGVQSE